MNDAFNLIATSIYSAALSQQRKINICIPKKYQEQNLPVLLLLDGGLNEKLIDFANLANTLIEEKVCKPFIIVGIENTERNFDFTNPTTVDKDKKWVPKSGNAANFKNFICLELLPEIKNKYKINTEFSIVGESLGGLLVMDLLYTNTNYFTNYIAIDPSLWWNNQTLYNKIKSNFDFNTLEAKKLWISTSKTQNIYKLTDELVELLNTKENLKSNWFYLQDKNQTHFTIYKATIKQAISWAFKLDQ